MPPSPNHYTASVNHDSLHFGHPLVVRAYEDFINDLAQSAIAPLIGISQIDVRNYIEQHRAELDRTADVLIEMFDLPRDDTNLDGTGPATSGATQQQGYNSQGVTNGDLNGQTNGNANGHANGHTDAASDHGGTDSDRNEDPMPDDMLSAPMTHNLTAVLQQDGSQRHANTNGDSTQAVPVQDHGNSSTGQGLSTTFVSYSPRPIRRQTMP